MKKRPYFFGKYYKFVARDGFSFAIIDSYSDGGKALQIITPQGGFNICSLQNNQISEQSIELNIHQNDISITGKISISNHHPLKHNAMGPFKLFAMECSHDVYSMYHDLKGQMIVNGETHIFDDGYGYIEGDKGRSFPKKYLWYNSVGPDYGLTVAIATIPFGLINFTGLLCFINYQGKEYRFCTYNFAKIIHYSPEKVIIKKGKYKVEISLNVEGGHMLKAPTQGMMDRLIKENVAVPTSFSFSKGKETILEKDDKLSSLEFMF